MSIEMRGLTEFQRDLLDVAERRLPRESKQIMQKVGNEAKKVVTKKARTLVKKSVKRENSKRKQNLYHKKFKRGKVFTGDNGETVVRVINSAPHAHLIEHGHRQVTHDGREVGFVPGKKVLEKGANEFNSSGKFENMLSEWLDKMLEEGKL